MPAFAPLMIMGGLQAGAGIAQMISGGGKQKRAMDEREANLFKTSDEVYEIEDFSQSLAGTGMDALTMNYLTNNLYRTTTQGLSSAERMGGGLNDIGSIIDKQIEGLMQVGAQNQQQRYKNFSQYLDALKLISQNKDAEWADRVNMIKDQMQAATEEKRAGMQSIIGGMNTMGSAFAMKQQAGMWDEFMGKLNPAESPKIAKDFAPLISMGPNTSPPSLSPGVPRSLFPSVNSALGIDEFIDALNKIRR